MRKSFKESLLSLIPDRELEDPDAILDELDEEALDEAESLAGEAGEDEELVMTESRAKPVKKQKRAGQKLKVVSEDEDEDEAEADADEEIELPEEADGDAEVIEDEMELPEGGEDMPIPEKPLVTPLTIEVDDEELGLKKKKSVEAKTEITKDEEALDEKEAEGLTIKKMKTSKVAAASEVKKKPAAVEVVKKAAAKVKVKDKTAASTGNATWDRHEGEVQHINITDIGINPNQPRRKFNQAEMDELISSIDQHGILQPLVVRRLAKGGYELVAGERRLRAAKTLEWDKVPCVVRRNVTSGASRLELALVENVQREDLNPVEVAMAYKQLNEEYGMTHEEIGERVGRSRVNVTNTIRVLQLPEEIQKGLMDDRITPGHAKAILMIPDRDKQIRFYRHLLEEGLTVRKAETRARRIQRAMDVDDPMRVKRKGRSAFEMKYGGLLEDRFGYDARVVFKEERNRFEVQFKCHSQDDDIKELLGRLMGSVGLPGDDTDRDVIADE